MEWSTIVTLLFGSGIGLVASLVTLILTTKASERAEERAATRKVGEEQREWVRKSRKERMKAVFDFLELAKEMLAESLVDDLTQGVEAGLEAELVVKALAAELPEPSEDEKRKYVQTIRDFFHTDGEQFDYYEFIRRAMRAMSTASNKDIGEKVKLIMMEGISSHKKIFKTKFDELIIEAEEAVERYIVGT